MCIRDRYQRRVRENHLFHCFQTGTCYDVSWSELSSTTPSSSRMFPHGTRSLRDVACSSGSDSGRSRWSSSPCLLYTSDAADDLLCVDLGGRRIIKKKKKHKLLCSTYD
eukprot:TRINITY_DN143_c0_g1_i15.p1 TRINITY_DN143_c0_g1~~TRINITY_DN143_c0_g1_i15.p1  ORF type:complete len:109 (+),score=32.33 TRINITY_DN143_c0_g1_i15:154-480(+)